MADQELSFDRMKKALCLLAESRNDWCGYPVPIHDFKLSIAPSLPYKNLDGMSFSDDIDMSEYDNIELVNSWHSYRYGYDVYIYEDTVTKERYHTVNPSTAGSRLTFALNNLGVSEAWDVKAELKAMKTLKSMVKEHIFDHYVLTGGFVETSERSGVTYFFRRLKPTVALKPRRGSMAILAALCLHPLGHYRGTFGGCMVPTDDVIAHLQMMRGDEHKFWAKSNHHPLHEVNSGI